MTCIHMSHVGECDRCLIVKLQARIATLESERDELLAAAKKVDKLYRSKNYDAVDFALMELSKTICELKGNE